MIVRCSKHQETAATINNLILLLLLFSRVKIVRYLPITFAQLRATRMKFLIRNEKTPKR